MTSNSVTQFRQKLYSLNKEANDSQEPIHITGELAASYPNLNTDLVPVSAGKFEELKVATGIRRQFSEIDQTVAKAKEKVVGGLVLKAREKVVSQYEIMLRVGRASQRHGNFLPASAHSDSEGEFNPVSQVDFPPSREVKTEKLRIPRETHGDTTEGIGFQVTAGVAELKISEKGFPCSSDPKAGPKSVFLVNLVGFPGHRSPIETGRMNECNRGNKINPKSSARR